MSIFPTPESVPPATAVAWSGYAEAKKRRSAGKAWLFSIIPGVGQLYCGAGIRGPALLAAFVGAAGVAIFVDNDFRWMGIRLLVMLFALVPYDAYETARELNAGIDADAPHNPRVAALLNLTTNGLGYVYIGHRLGFVVFILMMTVGRAVSVKFPLLMEIVVALLAIHVWKLAERKREES